MSNTTVIRLTERYLNGYEMENLEDAGSTASSEKIISSLKDSEITISQKEKSFASPALRPLPSHHYQEPLDDQVGNESKGILQRV